MVPDLSQNVILRHNNLIMTSFYRYFNILFYKIIKNDATCQKFGMPLEKHVNYQL